MNIPTTLIIVIGLLLVTFVAVQTLLSPYNRRRLMAFLQRDKTDLKQTNLRAQSRLAEGDDLAKAGRTATNRPPHTVALGWVLPQFKDYTDDEVFNAYRIGSELVVSEPDLPILVLGASGSGKTSGVAVPAILEWGTGPALVTSVKHDIMNLTYTERALHGPVVAFDPSASLPPHLARLARPWTPLAASVAWQAADATANALVRAYSQGNPAASERFWLQQAAQLLALLMFNRANDTGATMLDVVRDLSEVGAAPSTSGQATGLTRIDQSLEKRQSELELALRSPDPVLPGFTSPFGPNTKGLTHSLEGITAARLVGKMLSTVAGSAPATLGGVVATCQAVLKVYVSHPSIANVSRSTPNLLDPYEILRKNATLYVVAPGTDQELYAPLFTALVQHVMEAAFTTAGLRPDGKLPHPALFCLDELPHLAPLPKLPSYVSLARSHRITILMIAQDLSQLRERFGETLASSLTSNSSSFLVLPGTKDLPTLQLVDQLMGDHRREVVSKAQGKSAAKAAGESQTSFSETETTSHEWRRIAPPDRLAALRPYEMIGLVGHHKVQLSQRRWYDDEYLRAKQQTLASSPGPGRALFGATVAQVDLGDAQNYQ